jgi:hypothetical protein
LEFIERRTNAKFRRQSKAKATARSSFVHLDASKLRDAWTESEAP